MKHTLFYTLIAVAISVSQAAYAQFEEPVALEGDGVVQEAGAEVEAEAGRTAPPQKGQRPPLREETARAVQQRATTTRAIPPREAPRAGEQLNTRAQVNARAEIGKRVDVSTIAERRALHASTTAERRAMIAERVEAKKIAIATTTYEQLAKQSVKIQERMLGAVNKLEIALQKIDARAQILATRGIDVSESLRHLAVASEGIDVLREQVGAMSVDADYAFTDAKPREKWQEFREDIKNTKSDFDSVRASLKDAVEALKQSLLSAEDEKGASAAVRASDGTSEVEESSTVEQEQDITN